MRPKAPWSENLLLEVLSVYLTVILVGAFLFLLFSCIEVGKAHAEFYLEAAAGLSLFAPTSGGTTLEDGTWWQRGLNHSITNTGPVWKVGAGYAFNERWSVQAHFIRTNTSLTSEFVPDANYDHKRHVCVSACDQRQSLRATDKMQGIDLSVTRTFPFETVSPFVKVGAAVFEHQFTVNVLNSAWSERWYGKIPMVLVGAGLCWQEWLCAESTYYRGTNGMNGGCLGNTCGWPIAKELLLNVVSVKIPLTN